MKKVKILSSCIALLSFAYFVLGIFSIYDSIKMGQTFAYYGVPETTELYTFSIATYRTVIFYAGVVFLVSGVFTLVASVGIYRGQEWARKFWLRLTLLLSAMYFSWFVWCVIAQYFLLNQLGLTMLILAVSVVSWLMLTAEPMKSAFNNK